METDGVMGLYQGNSVTLLRIFPMQQSNLLPMNKFVLLIPNDSYETAARRFMAGSLSGLASVFSRIH